ncbi:MAG: HAMP domain-containing sensor histidine kinase [Rhizomicrobium sp.]|jgi:signal transduction histidine kinase
MSGSGYAMFRENATLVWSAVPIAGAMLADYAITILLLHAWAAYTPFVTLAIATLVSFPVAFALVSGRIDLRRARDELAAARDTAVNADQTKTMFFANVSHELRTPLNAIIGFSELLKSDAFAAKRREYADLIHSSGTHLLGLVNDLLDLARIEAGKFELQCETVGLGELIEECARIVEGRARDSGIRFGRKVAADLPLAFADRRALKQILLNLLTNAIKFTRRDGSVEVFARLVSSGELAFGVKDDGIGVAEEDQLRVFERFGQGRHDIAAIDEGTGLGLPIVKGLAEAHGGRVAMDSRLGEGTCVTVWLPRERLMFPKKIALAS